MTTRAPSRGALCGFFVLATLAATATSHAREPVPEHPLDVMSIVTTTTGAFTNLSH